MYLFKKNVIIFEIMTKESMKPKIIKMPLKSHWFVLEIVVALFFIENICCPWYK